MSTQRPLAVVILAAGFGTRMKSAQPKVMHKLAGLPMINWLLRTTDQLNPEKTIIVIGPDMPALKKAVAPHETVIQKERNGTAGALKCALPKLKGFEGDVLVLLGDMPLVRVETLQMLIATKSFDMLTAMSVLGMELQNPTGYGRLVLNKDETLKKIVEEKDATVKQKHITLVNSGAFCLEGARIEGWLKKVGNDNAQGEYYITDLPAIAGHEGAVARIAIAEDADELRGCNSRGDLAALEGIVQDRLRAEVLAGGTTLIAPETVFFSYDTEIAPDVVIEPHVVFGAGVKVASGTHIKAFSHLEGATVGKDVEMGPYARLRPDTVLKDNVRLGNFVEVKKSTIGKGSKINHLSYVGDCEMGEDVNFSAGAITVNYDGFQKHKTIIGKNVLIGSNVNLVAPLAIDDGAFVAAGSTITEDVPADALSIARDVAEIREGWAAEYRKRKALLLKKIGKTKSKKAG